MRTTSPRAFSLVELLIVVVILALLVAMLMPVAHSAWASAQTTQCQVNLGRIWQAMNARRTATGETVFAAGGTWPGCLAPYLEQSQTVLRCPLGPDRGAAAAAGGGSDAGGSPSGGSSGGGTGDLDPSAGSDDSVRDNRFTVSDLTFRMYSRGFQSVSGRNYADGQYLGTAFADSSFGVKKVDKGGGMYYFGIDDRQFFLDQNLGGEDYKDIQVNVWLDGDKLNKMEFLDSDFKTGGSYNVFRFEVFLGEEKVSNDFVADLKRVIDFSGDAPSGMGGGTTGFGGTGGELLTSFAALGPVKSFDYGLNKATFDSDGQRVTGIDPRLILILDYGKSVADYESAGTGKRDDWYLFFTDDQAKWMDIYHSLLRPSETWLKYMSLRHFGKANVLFCDGHIDALGPDELAETNETLWKFGGK